MEILRNHLYQVRSIATTVLNLSTTLLLLLLLLYCICKPGNIYRYTYIFNGTHRHLPKVYNVAWHSLLGAFFFPTIGLEHTQICRGAASDLYGQWRFRMYFHVQPSFPVSAMTMFQAPNLQCYFCTLRTPGIYINFTQSYAS